MTTHTSYIGRRWSFDSSATPLTGTVASEPFTIRLGQANGNGLTDEVTHGCVAVSLDVEHRHYGPGGNWIGVIVGHIDDVDPA